MEKATEQNSTKQSTEPACPIQEINDRKIMAPPKRSFIASDICGNLAVRYTAARET